MPKRKPAFAAQRNKEGKETGKIVPFWRQADPTSVVREGEAMKRKAKRKKRAKKKEY